MTIYQVCTTKSIQVVQNHEKKMSFHLHLFRVNQLLQHAKNIKLKVITQENIILFLEHVVGNYWVFLTSIQKSTIFEERE